MILKPMSLNKITNEDLLNQIQTQFGDSILEQNEAYGLMNIYVPADKAKEIVLWLKEHETIKMSYLTNIAAVHYPFNKGAELEIVYQLHSLQNNTRLRVKSKLSIDNPTIATITDIYAGADWMERETYDFFGVIFEGHPNLKKILNMEDQDYFPMRKEYPLEDATREDKDNRFFGR